MSDLICVFDVGTTGTRTIIFDAEGKEICKAYEEYVIPDQPVGISEQDPKVWWNAIIQTCNKVVNSGKFNPKDIVGISASFSRATVTIINREGEILHPALTWMDEREITTAKDWDRETDLRRVINQIFLVKHIKLFLLIHLLI
jgi:xylulokinase